MSRSSSVMLSDSNFIDSFSWLLEHASTFADVHFLVGSSALSQEKTRYASHRCIWACRTSRIHAHLEQARLEDESGLPLVVVDENVSIEEFERCLEFIYTGKTEFFTEDVIDLLYAATELGIESLRELCILHALETIRDETVFGYLGISFIVDVDRLRIATLKYIAENAHRVLLRDEFADLQCRAVEAVAQEPGLKTTESILFKALLTWSLSKTLHRKFSIETCVEDAAKSSFSEQERIRESLERFLRFLRQDLFSYEEIDSILEKCQVVSQDFILESYKIRARASEPKPNEKRSRASF